MKLKKIYQMYRISGFVRNLKSTFAPPIQSRTKSVDWKLIDVVVQYEPTKTETSVKKEKIFIGGRLSVNPGSIKFFDKHDRNYFDFIGKF